MEGVFEWCFKCAAAFLFCMALSLGFYQFSQVHKTMETWKTMSQMEQDIGESDGEYR